MIAVNASTSNIPRLLIVKVAPEMSAGCSLFGARALGQLLRRLAMSPSGAVSALRMTAVTTALSTAIASATLTSGLQRDRAVDPAGVHARMLAQRARDGGDQQIGVRHLHAVRRLDRRNQLLARAR